MAPGRFKGKKHGPRLPALVVLALLAAGFVLLLDGIGVLTPVEHKAYDGMVYARSIIRPAPDRPDSPVIVVAVDDKTFDDPEFRIPQILWHEHFAAVILGLVDARATAVGLDFLLPRALFDNIAPGYSRVWLKTFGLARVKKVPVITGFIQGTGEQMLPEKRYLQLIGADHLGVFNLASDSDDFIRRHRLFYPAPGETDKGTYSVTFLLARQKEPDLALPAHEILIDYSTARRPFPVYSFTDVYKKVKDGDAEYLNQNFQGRIVLIGQTDMISQDRHATPLYHIETGGDRRTPGVEILAHTINTLLGGRFFTALSLPARGAIYFGLALVVGLLTLFAATRLVLPAGFVVVWAGWLAACQAAFLDYGIWPAAGGTAVLFVNLGGSFAYRHLVLDREKRMVKSAFSLYLSPEVVKQVLDNPDLLSLGGSRRRMTAFFSDLAGFTGISEKLAPEELVGLLNRYLSRMTRAIMGRGGTVDKFEGDAIMAFWGAPVSQDDHALRACLSALEQQRLIREFRRETQQENLPELTVRMGINTGDMIVGNMGSEERFDYTVMGDAVNLASRLEGANKTFGTLIMISQSTYEEVKDRVEVRELDLLQVKGRAEPVRVYELAAEAGGLTETQSGLIRDFHQGLALYRARRFEEAGRVFEAILESNPDDGPSRTYRERCRAFMDQPPPDDWDGVFTMTTK